MLLTIFLSNDKFFTIWIKIKIIYLREVKLKLKMICIKCFYRKSIGIKE